LTAEATVTTAALLRWLTVRARAVCPCDARAARDF